MELDPPLIINDESVGIESKISNEEMKLKMLENLSESLNILSREFNTNETIDLLEKQIETKTKEIGILERRYLESEATIRKKLEENFKLQKENESLEEHAVMFENLVEELQQKLNIMLHEQS